MSCQNESLLPGFATNNHRHLLKENQLSQRQLAKRFGVSLSFIQTLLKCYRKEGTIARFPHGEGKSPLLSPAHQEQLRQLVEDNNNATLEELCQLLYQQMQV